MRLAALVCAILMAAGCGSREASRASAPEQKSEPKRDQRLVELDAAGQRSAGVAVEQADLRELPEIVRATARLSNNENQTWRVGAITDGRIVSVLVSPGDSVKVDQVLARMHSHDIHESRAEYQKAVAELTRAKAQQDYAQRARDRARRLFDLKAASQEQAEHAETELKNAQAAVANAQTEVGRVKNHLTEFLGIPVEHPDHPGDRPHDVSDEGEFIPVKSPAAGVLLTRNVTPGTVVTPSNDLFVVSDLSTLWAIAEVNEEYLSRLRPGMPAHVYVQAYGKESFSGRIATLGESFDPQTRTVKVRINVPNPRGRLKPEMYASVEIEIGGSQPAIFVSQEATQEVRGDTVVFVRISPDKFEVRPVQTGRTVGGSVEVLRGLKPGEAVAARGTFILKTEYLKASLSEE